MTYDSFIQLVQSPLVHHNDAVLSQTKLNENGVNVDGNEALYKYLMLAPSARPPSGSISQENTCLVCGAYYQWQDLLAKHFTQVF